MYTNFLNHYSKAKLEKKDFKTYFKEKGYNNIAIYGFGTTGKLLYNEIKKDINICCIIDKNVNKEINVIKPEEISNYKNISKIIVTPYFQFFNIKRELRNYTTVEIISLRDVLSELKSEQDMIELSKFLLEKNAQFHFLFRPFLEDIKNPSIYEKTTLFIDTMRKGTKHYEYFKENVFNDMDNINIKDLQTLFDFNSKSSRNEKREKLFDTKSKYFNIINSYRYIPDYPDFINKKIYIFGDCSSFGSFTEDKRTAANILQKKINSNNLSYGVYAYAAVITDISYIFELIKKLPLEDGDIILYVSTIVSNCYKFFHNLENIYEYNLTSFFERPHAYGEIFIDNIHIANRGQILLGNAIYDSIKDNLDNNLNRNLIQNNSKNFNLTIDSILDIKKCDELNNYIKYLKEEKVQTDGVVGCIVMNCNPFTFGHLYLIEKACTYVDILYIFCVEEDESIFKFNERFDLLIENTKHLKNVKVLKSGKYIISFLTFNSYFLKENYQDIIIDATCDLEIFCKYIAPILNISIRFAGTEPI